MIQITVTCQSNYMRLLQTCLVRRIAGFVEILWLSCQLINQCTSKQVCETHYQHSDTPSKSACKYRHVEVSFPNQPSTTAHFLSNKTSFGNSNQIVSFTMSIVLFSDLLYSCRVCSQLCVAEYVLQIGQGRPSSFM